MSSRTMITLFARNLFLVASHRVIIETLFHSSKRGKLYIRWIHQLSCAWLLLTIGAQKRRSRKYPRFRMRAVTLLFAAPLRLPQQEFPHPPGR